MTPCSLRPKIAEFTGALFLMLALCSTGLAQWTPPGDKPPFHHRSGSSKTPTPPAGIRRYNPDSSSLTVRCKVDCTISIDKGWKLRMFAGRSRTLSVPPGSRSIFVRAADGRSTWQTSFTLAKGGRKELLFPVGLQPHRDVGIANAERNQLVVQIARIREEIEANRQRTAEIRAEQAQMLRAQQARNVRRAELQQKAEAIVNQIRAYETQAEQEEAQAVQDEKDAQQAYNMGAASSLQGTKLGKILGVGGVAVSTVGKISAQNHRQHVQQLTAEMNRLSHELYLLTKP
jgi:hypothetical protein